MHCKLTDYQIKVLSNAFEGKVLYQHTGENNKLLDEYYCYPIVGEKYSLPRSKHGDHSINKFAFNKLLSEGLIEPDGFMRFIITRKGQEQIMGHKNFKAEQL
jgi:hypothetical protein